MKKSVFSKFIGMAACFSAISVVSVGAQAAPQTILDTYIGSNDHGYGDVIGHTNKFGIDSVVMDLTGSILTIEVHTAFANTDAASPGLGSYPSLTVGNTGILFGDLFLADEWTPFTNGTTSTAANGYKGDNVNTGTDWDYGFSLANRASATGGAGTWYDLTGDVGSENSQILLSEQFLSGGIFRNGQEVAVNVADGVVNQAGSWSVDNINNIISFSMNIAGTTLASSSTIGFHWGMSCGNDVIEGVFTKPIIDDEEEVPEPGTMALMLISLLGFARGRKYLKK